MSELQITLISIFQAIRGIEARLDALTAHLQPKTAKPADPAQAATETQAVTDFLASWRECRGDLPEARSAPAGTARRRRILAAIKAEPDRAVWAGAMRALAASSFHRGGNDRGWVANIDFLISPGQWLKWCDIGRQGKAKPAAMAPTATWCAECGVREVAAGDVVCGECQL